MLISSDSSRVAYTSYYQQNTAIIRDKNPSFKGQKPKFQGTKTQVSRDKNPSFGVNKGQKPKFQKMWNSNKGQKPKF